MSKLPTPVWKSGFDYLYVIQFRLRIPAKGLYNAGDRGM